MNILDIFKSLAGLWKINRTITNNGVMVGEARFIPNMVNELLYREEGIYTSNSSLRNFKVYREYLYRFLDNQISVFHMENNNSKNLLHVLKFMPQIKNSLPRQAFADHRCGPDLYHSSYLFFNNQFQLQYNVTGPNKNYTIISIFERLLS